MFLIMFRIIFNKRIISIAVADGCLLVYVVSHVPWINLWDSCGSKMLLVHSNSHTLVSYYFG